MVIRVASVFVVFSALISAAWTPHHPYLHAPSVETYATHNPAGRTILSTGRYLTPVGKHIPVGRMPYGLAISRDGKMLFVASAGVGQIITDWRQAKPAVTIVSPPSAKKWESDRRGHECGRRRLFARRANAVLEQWRIGSRLCH